MTLRLIFFHMENNHNLPRGTNKSSVEKEASKLYSHSHLCTVIYAHPAVIHFLHSLKQFMEDNSPLEAAKHKHFFQPGGAWIHIHDGMSGLAYRDTMTGEKKKKGNIESLLESQ